MRARGVGDGGKRFSQGTLQDVGPFVRGVVCRSTKYDNLHLTPSLKLTSSSSAGGSS